MSEIYVQDLAQSFISSMWNHKEKWLAQEDENHFDVVNEVRQLMDDCLTQNGMGVDLTEKIIVAAYSPTVLTSNSMNAIWTNNASNSPKIQALSAAANNIIQLLVDGSEMGRLTTRFPDEFDFRCIISIPQTSQFTGILNNLYNRIISLVSTSQDTISIVDIYHNLPLYMLDGMAEMHDIYVNSHVAGLHMDENNWDWRRCPNPYTIDSVALDLMKAGKPVQHIEQYEDYQILLNVKKQTEDGMHKYHFIEYQGHDMILYDIYSDRVDMKVFKEKLREEAKEQGETFELIPFMKNNGFVFRPEIISTFPTDIDLTLTSFDSIDMNDPRYSVYQEIPVPIPELYKWMRSRVKYMDILERNTKLFEELYEV